MHDKLARAHKHTSRHAESQRQSYRHVTADKWPQTIKTGTRRQETGHKDRLLHHNRVMLIFFKQENELTHIITPTHTP